MIDKTCTWRMNNCMSAGAVVVPESNVFGGRTRFPCADEFGTLYIAKPRMLMDDDLCNI
jgi:hypothetical protein